MLSERVRQILGVSPDASEADVARAFAGRMQDLEVRIAKAPTSALQEKFRQQQEELKEAWRPVGQANAPSNFPVARASAAPSSDAGEGREAGERFALAEKVADTPLGPLFNACDAAGAPIALCRAPAGQTQNWRQVFLLRAEASRQHLPPQAGGVTDLGEDPAPFYASLPLHGRLLRDELEEARRVRRQLPVTETVKVIGALARTLAGAHPGFVHGDIRPETVWLCPDGGLRLLGFAAPGREARPMDDQTGLAALLWEMLTFRPPAALREDLSALRPDAPPTLGKVLQRAMHHDGAERFSDMRSFAAALGRGERLTGAVSRFGGARMAMAIAAALAILAAAYAYPSWKAMTPWEMAAEKQRAVMLAGMVKQMKAQQEAALSDLRKQLTESESALNALADKRDGLAPGAYSNIVPRYYRAVLDHAGKQSLVSRYEALAMPLDSEVAEADALMAAGDMAASLTRFEALQQRLRASAGLRQAAEGDVARERLAAASALAGNWSDGACGAAASRWAVGNDGMLRISWPGHGDYVERILGAREGAIFTEGVSQNDAPGQLVRYTPSGSVLTIDTYGEQHMQMRFTRC